MNTTLDLQLEPLDTIESPMSTGEGIGWALIGFGVGLGIGALIT